MNINAFIYNLLIDPLLSDLRKTITRILPGNTNVIDIACATGTQAFLLASKCKHVTAIDMSESIIDYAEKKRRKLSVRNLVFTVADAADLSRFGKHQFEYSTMILALHQFAPDIRDQILLEVSRISEKIIIADYAVPQPRNFYGWFANIIEILAGKQHHSYFRNYCLSGGLLKIASDAGLKLNHTILTGNGVFRIGFFESDNMK